MSAVKVWCGVVAGQVAVVGGLLLWPGHGGADPAASTASAVVEVVPSSGVLRVGCGRPGGERPTVMGGLLGGLYSCTVDPGALCRELADGSGRAFNSLQALGADSPRLWCARNGLDPVAPTPAPAPSVPVVPPAGLPATSSDRCAEA